jgi:hypothetical protein
MITGLKYQTKDADQNKKELKEKPNTPKKTNTIVYLPPKHTVKRKQLEDFYNNLGFIAGGDYNAKHTNWGSRLITSRGCEVLKMFERNNLKHISMGKPTYWPSDRNKLPDLVDLCVTKGIPQDIIIIIIIIIIIVVF